MHETFDRLIKSKTVGRDVNYSVLGRCSSLLVLPRFQVPLNTESPVGM